jgi:hypothetical protein
MTHDLWTAVLAPSDQYFGEEEEMKYLGTLVLSFLLANPVPAQQNPQPVQPSQPAAGKTISSQLGLHAFPAKGQSREQQQTDEIACYGWAKQDTSFDPLAALTAAAQSSNNSAANSGATPASGTPQGAGAKGAARGAAAGAAVGAAAGDPGRGAAIGAAGGGIRGRIAQKRAQAEAQQKSQQAAQQQAQQQAKAKAQTQAGLEDFKKAYGACMDGKGYSVK